MVGERGATRPGELRRRGAHAAVGVGDGGDADPIQQRDVADVLLPHHPGADQAVAKLIHSRAPPAADRARRRATPAFRGGRRRRAPCGAPSRCPCGRLAAARRAMKPASVKVTWSTRIRSGAAARTSSIAASAASGSSSRWRGPQSSSPAVSSAASMAASRSPAKGTSNVDRAIGRIPSFIQSPPCTVVHAVSRVAAERRPAAATRRATLHGGAGPALRDGRGVPGSAGVPPATGRRPGIFDGIRGRDSTRRRDRSNSLPGRHAAVPCTSRASGVQPCRTNSEP